MTSHPLQRFQGMGAQAIASKLLTENHGDQRTAEAKAWELAEYVQGPPDQPRNDMHRLVMESVRAIVLGDEDPPVARAESRQAQYVG